VIGYSLKAAEFTAPGVFVVDMPSRLDIEPGPLFISDKVYFSGVVLSYVDRIALLYQKKIHRLFNRWLVRALMMWESIYGLIRLI
jgi:hypothetical protein